MNSRPSSTRPYHHSQRGFSLVMMFAAIAGLMAVVTWYVIAPGARYGIGTGAEVSAQAAGIIQQGALLEGAFVTKLAQGIPAGTISYDNVAPSGMLVNSNTTNASGLISTPVPSPDAFRATGPLDGLWIYRGAGMAFPGVGDDSNFDYSFVLTNLKQAVCEQINLQLHGDTNIPTTGGASQYRNSAPSDTTTINTMQSEVNHSGWTSGCLMMHMAGYVYFQVVLAR